MAETNKTTEDVTLRTVLDVVLGLQSEMQTLRQVGQQGTQDTQQADQSTQGLAQSVQEAKQLGQSNQQELQSLKAATAVSGSNSSDSSSRTNTSESKQEEINTGEAFRASVFTDKELWGADKKLIFADEHKYKMLIAMNELKEKQLEIAEREAKLRHQAKTDSIEVSEKENNALIKHLAAFRYGLPKPDEDSKK